MAGVGISAGASLERTRPLRRVGVSCEALGNAARRLGIRRADAGLSRNAGRGDPQPLRRGTKSLLRQGQVEVLAEVILWRCSLILETHAVLNS